jgi:hypothetical protein
MECGYGLLRDIGGRDNWVVMTRYPSASNLWLAADAAVTAVLFCWSCARCCAGTFFVAAVADALLLCMTALLLLLCSLLALLLCCAAVMLCCLSILTLLLLLFLCCAAVLLLCCATFDNCCCCCCCWPLLCCATVLLYCATVLYCYCTGVLRSSVHYAGWTTRQARDAGSFLVRSARGHASAGGGSGSCCAALSARVGPATAHRFVSAGWRWQWSPSSHAVLMKSWHPPLEDQETRSSFFDRYWATMHCYCRLRYRQRGPRAILQALYVTVWYPERACCKAPQMDFLNIRPCIWWSLL